MTCPSFTRSAGLHRSHGVLRRSLHVVLLAVLVSQMLAPLWGQWHRIAHSAFAQSVWAASTGAHGDEALPARHGGVGHGEAAQAPSHAHLAGDALCQLLDQLSLTAGPLAHVPLMQTLALPCSDVSVALTAALGPLAWALFEARAPPLP